MSTARRVYLDHNASAPLLPEARAAMIAALDLDGNASSVHEEGRRARATVENAREAVATLVGARPEEVVFTSGATEANNWAVQCAADRLAVGACEHESILAPARAVDPALVELPCGSDGTIIVNGALLAEARAWEGRGCLSLQLANGETGVLQDVSKAASSARSLGLIAHCDAVQAVGRVSVDLGVLGVELMSVSSHKIGGPKGAGALIIRGGLDLKPLMAGGGQERRRRSGTENVAAIAGFGAAAKAAKAGLERMREIARLRDRLEAGISSITPQAVVIGGEAARLPNTSCVALPEAQAATSLIKLDLAGIAVSAGSACSSGKISGSHVLAAMGVKKRLAESAIRISLGHTTTETDIELFLVAWEAMHGRPKTGQRGKWSTETAPVGQPLGQASAGE